MPKLSREFASIAPLHVEKFMHVGRNSCYILNMLDDESSVPTGFITLETE